MKERPIIFSGLMVRAILEGHKTQTRRVVKDPDHFGCLTGDCSHDKQTECDLAMTAMCPFWQPGDQLWVRENAYIAGPNDFDSDAGNLVDINGRRRVVGYSASMDAEAVGIAKEYGVKQTPSIHMPRWASRITLDITDVQVALLQDISEEDAITEGVQPKLGETAIHAFMQLWCRIYGESSWDTNPWVWVVTFRRVQP